MSIEVYTTPSISVIVPVTSQTINRGHNLERCLKSICTQSCRNIEIICVYDESVDFALLSKELGVNDSRINFLSQAKRGLSTAFNVGLDHAKGEFVAFVSPSGYYPESGILQELYESGKRVCTKICGGSLGYIHPTSGEVHKDDSNPAHVFEFEGEHAFADYQYDSGIQRFIFDRNFIQRNKLRFSERKLFGESLFLVRAMHKAGTFCAIRNITYACSEETSSCTWDDAKCNDFFAELKEEWEFATANRLYRLEQYIWQRLSATSELIQDYLNEAQKQFAALIEHTILTYEPLVSVIVPVYKTENTLRKCLDSICNQTYRNLEIICVNDGSPDNSLSILQEYASRDHRLKIINQSNKGLSGARNSGLDVATGDWITGVDSDDYIDLDTYEYCLPMMRHPLPSIICFGTRIVGDSNCSQDEYFTLHQSDVQFVTDELLASTNVCFWNKLYRGDLIRLRKQRFLEGVWYEDEGFFNSFAPYTAHIGYLPEKKYSYVQMPGEQSIMAKTRAGHPKLKDRLIIMDYLLSYFEKHALYPRTANVRLQVAINYYITLIRWVSESNSPLSTFECWQEYRDVVQKHDLTDLYSTSSYFASLYDLPPDAHHKYWDKMVQLENCNNVNLNRIHSLESIIGEMKRRETVILNYPKARKKYLKYKIKKLFSWGKQRKRYKEKMKEQKSIIREYRHIIAAN